MSAEQAVGLLVQAEESCTNAMGAAHGTHAAITTTLDLIRQTKAVGFSPRQMQEVEAQASGIHADMGNLINRLNSLKSSISAARRG